MKKPPIVFDIQLSGSRLYLATNAGLWSATLPEGKLLQLPSVALLKEVRSFDADSSTGDFWVIASSQLFHSSDAGKTWLLVPPPAPPAELLWIRQLPHSSGNALVLLGTRNGVFSLPATNADSWRSIQSGLPASPTHTPQFSLDTIVVSSTITGIYLSRDSATSWQRLDGSAETGLFTDLLFDGHGGFFAASRTEGILHWSPQ
jgi:hypothetical protein